MLKGYYLFDDEPQQYFGGGKYPKRKMKYSPAVEDKAIYLKGIHVGYMLSAIPWLHPVSWKGIGIKLDNIPDANELIEERKHNIEQWKKEEK